MSPYISTGRVARGSITFAALLLILSLFESSLLNAQSCTASATVPTVHAEGYTEPIGTYTFTCTGGTTGTRVNLTLYAAVGANITNRVDNNGIPMGITFATTPGVFIGAVTMYAPTTLQISQVFYTVGVPTMPVTIAISGILAAAATAANGTNTIPTLSGSALVVGGAQYSGPSSFPVALLSPTLVSSNINSGIPCNGSPLPPTIDFPTFIATGTVASAIRVTEATATAFTPKTTGTDTGLRILVKLSGYTAGARVFVPDAIVGSDAGATPTGIGLYNVGVNPGTYSPGNNELLLMRVVGADPTAGTGGTFALTVPTGTTTFSSVSEITLTSGSGYVVYEVVDANPGVVETAQIPVWVVNPQTSCTGITPQPTFSPMIAPVSTVSVATTSDPIPRFMATTPGTDCTEIGDCMAGYFPTLAVNPTSLNFTSASLGASQQSTINVGNSGGGLLSWAVSVTYPSGSTSGWLTVTPLSGQNTGVVQVTASPALLTPGTYTATISITAGTQVSQIQVTFTVGQVGVTIQSVGNAASYQTGTIAPGSYAVIFGQNLSGSVLTTVTFNSVPGTIVYNNATQINVIAPANLTNTQASVVVTVDGKPSNPFRVNLANDPGIFSNGIVNLADGQINVQSDPVVRGNFVVVYLTGLVLPPTGPIVVNIGSQMNIIPSFAGAQGTFPGLDQVNVSVPLSLPASPNPVPLTVCIPGSPAQVCSNPVNLYIQ